MNTEAMDHETTWHLELYRKLYLIRRTEELIQERYGEGEMKTPVHLCIGQEAVSVGVCDALAPDDQVVGTYRSHGLYLALADDPEGLFGELYGRVSGPARGKAGSMHLSLPRRGLVFTSAVVGSTIPLAVGMAYANRLRHPERCVAAFFGDGAIDEGCFWESLNFACLKRLRVLFVCEDNGLAIHTRSADRHGYRSIREVVSGFQCHVQGSRSSDVAEISALARRALELQRQDGQPSFLHLQCYRFVEHVGPRMESDFHLGFRDAADHADWLERDPLILQRARVQSRGISDALLSALQKEIDERLHRAVDRARQTPFPSAEELVKEVCSEAMSS
jgi:TPP-dependent pyruvate/acetoin dehydrogenase alpha subunit